TSWENPWFIGGSDLSTNWSAWATTSGTSRQLIISQNLFPSSLNNTDWLDQGAAGAFVAHAQALAKNLVAAGLGGSVIRLAHEANDTGGPYSLGTTPQEWAQWRQF